MKKVSVIVPNFNYGAYLPERLASIEAQYYPIYELIIIDDGSDDDSREIIEAFAERTPLNVKTVFSDSNSGSVFGQWVKGIGMAKGECIWIAEADDLCRPEFLLELMRFFEDPDVVLAYSMSAVIDEGGKLLSEHYLSGYADLDSGRWQSDYVRDGVDEIRGTFAVKNIIPNVSSVVFKNVDIASIKDTLTTYTVAGDWFFYIRLLEQGKIAYSHKALNFWRRHEKSVSGSVEHRKRHLREIVSIQEMIAEKYTVTVKTLEKALAFRKTMRLWLRVYYDSIEKYLFIITYGESGSEKLMRHLNSMTNVRIRGENQGILTKIHESRQLLTEAKRHRSDKASEKDHPWYGINEIDPDFYTADLCHAFVTDILQPEETTEIVGFKEIRFLYQSQKYLDGYVDFLFRFFPDCHILFYRNNLEKIISSGWMSREDPSSLLPHLQKLDQWMHECHKRYPDKTTLLFHGEWKDDDISSLLS
jgi:glycosyltransferase involved in cell wall biosynthesis